MGIGILGQSALVVAVTAFSLALTSLTKNLRNKLTQSFAVLCLFISFWGFTFFLEKVFGTGLFNEFHLAFNLLLAPVGLSFLKVLTRVDSLLYRLLYRAAILYTLVVGFLAWTSIGNPEFLRNLASLGPNFIILGCIQIILVRWRMLKKQTLIPGRALSLGVSRRIWIYIGGILITTTAVMDHVPRVGEVVPSIGNVLLCIYLFIVHEVIIHQRLLNFAALLSRVLILVFISAWFTLIYTLFVAWVDNSPALFILNSFLASFVMLMLIDPMKKLSNWSIVRLFNRKYQHFEDQVREAERSLIGVLDSQGLANLTLGYIKQMLSCDSASFFVLRSDGTKYHRIRGFQDEGLGAREILAKHPILDFFQWMRKRDKTPVLLYQFVETERDRSTSNVQKEFFASVLSALQSCNANIAIPLMGVSPQSPVVGFVLINCKQPPAPWDDWSALTVMYPFFEKASEIIQNLDVYVRLREKERLATLGEMAAGLAHEIRNPLGAIKGAAQLLQPQTDPHQTEILQVIVEEVNRLNKVVSQFLDYSRPLKVEKSTIEIAPILEKTLAFFESAQAINFQAKKPKIILAQSIDELRTLPPIHCAPEQLKQVLINFVQNSMQALSAETDIVDPVIAIGAYSVENQLGEGSEVAIYVEDNGPGIAAEDLDRIFVPFFTNKKSGTGLGLSISARIVESHGGYIDVHSERGKLTRFTITLPTKGSARL